MNSASIYCAIFPFLSLLLFTSFVFFLLPLAVNATGAEDEQGRQILPSAEGYPEKCWRLWVLPNPSKDGRWAATEWSQSLAQAWEGCFPPRSQLWVTAHSSSFTGEKLVNNCPGSVQQMYVEVPMCLGKWCKQSGERRQHTGNQAPAFQDL